MLTESNPSRHTPLVTGPLLVAGGSRLRTLLTTAANVARLQSRHVNIEQSLCSAQKRCVVRVFTWVVADANPTGSKLIAGGAIGQSSARHVRPLMSFVYHLAEQ